MVGGLVDLYDRLMSAHRPRPPKLDPRRYDPQALTLHYEWIERILDFSIWGNINNPEPIVWMSERQKKEFADFQHVVRKKAHSGEWGDYATVTVSPEIQGIVEDILGISFEAAMTCYNCGVEFPDLDSLDSHEETCGL